MTIHNGHIPHSSLATSRFVEEFELSEPARRYLFGTNCYAEALSDLYTFAAVVDETTKHSKWRGMPVLSLEQLPAGAMVICTATGRPQQAMRKLAARGVWAIDFFSFRKYRPHGLPPIRFNEDFNNEFLRNEGKFEKVYSQLGDLESKKIFSKLIDFRLNQNLSTIADFREDFSRQYFDDCLQLKWNSETFFDIGGFEGETTLAFLDRAGPESRALVFEPETENFERCKRNLSHLPTAEVFNVALSDGNSAGLMVGAGSNARVETSSGSGAILPRLDNYRAAKPTFIKIDVEGHEIQVLSGAERVLAQMSPKLAISTYHQPDHFWRIPELVWSMQPGYTLLLRHYTESIYESVYYFLPPEHGYGQGKVK